MSDEEMREAAKEVGVDDAEDKSPEELEKAAQEAASDSAISPTNPELRDGKESGTVRSD